MDSEENGYTHIGIKKETKERLDKTATKEDTYDSFINKLLDCYDKMRKARVDR